MELLYIWINNYKNIQNQGFNFSPRWRFDYDAVSGILDIEDRKDAVVEDFFGERIVNVTAIVGENGVGKSNLIEFITKHFNENLQFIRDVFFMVFIKDNTLFIWHPENIKIKIIGYPIQLKIETRAFIIPDNLDETKLDMNGVLGKDFLVQSAYISNSVEGRLRYKEQYYSKNFWDLSKDKSIKASIDFGYEQSNHVFIREDDFIIDEISRETKFISEWGDKLSKIRKPDYLKITPSIDIALIGLGHFKDRTLRNTDFKAGISRIEDFFSGKDAYTQIFGQLIVNSMFETLHRWHKADEFFEYFISQISSLNPTDEYDSIILKDFYLHISERINSFMKWLKQEPEIGLNDNGDSFVMPFKKAKEFFKEIDFMNTLQIARPFFYYSWEFDNKYRNGGFSTGEKALISIFSKINQLKYALLRKPTFLFIDEGEANLHPNFQKNYLQGLVSNIPKVLGHTDVKYQLIITSHSPFVASDLPKENIIFLSKNEKGLCQVVDGLNEKKQTFGANIHTLLTDSFFMDGLIGDFAQEKINQVIDYLNDYPNNTAITLVDAKKIVNMIGEPILKKHLQQQIKLIEIGKANKNEEEIATLKQRIEDLETALKNKSEN